MLDGNDKLAAIIRRTLKDCQDHREKKGDGKRGSYAKTYRSCNVCRCMTHSDSLVIPYWYKGNEKGMFNKVCNVCYERLLKKRRMK